MKKLLLLLGILLFTPTFSQTEKEQKIQKVVERNNPQDRNTVGTPPVIVTPQPNYGPYYNPYPNYYRRNRWDNRRYYQNQSLYTPAPIIVSRQNQQEMFAMGLIGSIMTNHPSTLGVRMTVGGKRMYLFGSFSVSPNNPYSHYDNITLLDVFVWGDEYKFDFNRTTTWDIGIGMKVNKHIYPTVSVGSTNVRTYMIHYDDLKVLSDNGYYSINGSKNQIFSLTGGVDFHINDYVIINTGVGLSGPQRIIIGTQIKFQ